LPVAEEKKDFTYAADKGVRDPAESQKREGIGTGRGLENREKGREKNLEKRKKHCKRDQRGGPVCGTTTEGRENLTGRRRNTHAQEATLGTEIQVVRNGDTEGRDLLPRK